MAVLTPFEWNSFLEGHPEAHILQTEAWGNLKSHFEWDVSYVAVKGTGAQVLFRQLPLGLSIAYIPKGPVGKISEQFLSELDRLCKQKKAIFLKIEPDLLDPLSQPVEEQFIKIGQPSVTVQPRRTVVIDLSGDEDQWLNRMKQKTRYNIRLAQRKEVCVRQSDDLETFQQLMHITGERDGFGVHHPTYYRRAFDLFAPAGACALFVAEFQGRPLAGLMVFAWGKRAWYFYGASSDEERNRMPAYLLQWEAIRWAAEKGCELYDLWGIPDVDEQELEDHFINRSDGLWGVYRFKRGFGGQIVRSAGAWDRVYQPLLYRAYQYLSSRRTGVMG